MSEHEPFTVAARRRHLEMLVVSVVIVLLSVLLQVPADQKVVVTGFPQLPLPQMCMSRAWFGVECPGCGLTRSFIHLAHGDWRGAWEMHRLGWLLFLSVLAQFPYRLYALTRQVNAPLGIRFPKYFGYVLITLLIGNWLLKSFCL